jgi:hypothetical protein
VLAHTINFSLEVAVVIERVAVGSSGALNGTGKEIDLINLGLDLGLNVSDDAAQFDVL